MDVRILDVSALVGNLKKMLKRLIGENIELTTTLADNPGRVRADPVQIEQIVMNLAVNARDAMPSGGNLTIITQPVELDGAYARQHLGVVPGPYLMLAVSDTGEGMVPEVRERIFEPFFTTKPEGKGTGLGLSMVYGIVKQSGGDIWVYSEPGRGSTFKVFLPRVEEPSTPTDEENLLTKLPHGTETILLVEDEAPVRAMVRSVLAEQGYTVLEASNGHEALDLCGRQSGPIHLLLTDMVMPGMNGLQVAERLRAFRPELQILFMSGYIEHDVIAEGFVKDTGAHLLQKPFPVLELCRRVRQALDEARAQVPVGSDR